MIQSTKIQRYRSLLLTFFSRLSVPVDCSKFIQFHVISFEQSTVHNLKFVEDKA